MRPTGSPNNLNRYTVRQPRTLKTAAEKPKHKGGKIKVDVYMPPYLYDQVRKEALDTGQAFRRTLVTMIEAAAADFPD